MVTCFSFSSGAFLRISKRSAGKPITRPSVSSIYIILPSAQARRAQGSLSTGMVFMEFLQKQLLVLVYKSLDFSYLMRWNTSISRNRYWQQPKFAFTISTTNMNMRRLRSFIRIKVKPKTFYSQNSRHIIPYSKPNGLIQPREARALAGVPCSAFLAEPRYNISSILPRSLSNPMTLWPSRI